MEEKRIGAEDIQAMLPHRPPFLFVDRVTGLEAGKRIVAERDLRKDEPHFRGHFPAKAIMPGVLVTEALAQTAGLLLGLSQKAGVDMVSGQPGLGYLAAVNVKFTGPAFPGETLTLRADFERRLGPLYHFSVEAAAGRRPVARGSLTLAMGVEKP